MTAISSGMRTRTSRPRSIGIRRCWWRRACCRRRRLPDRQSDLVDPLVDLRAVAVLIELPLHAEGVVPVGGFGVEGASDGNGLIVDPQRVVAILPRRDALDVPRNV